MDQTEFIINTSANFFSLYQNDKHPDDTFVKDFLENDEQKIITASLNESKKSLIFQSKIPNENQSSLLFYKIKRLDGHKAGLGLLTLEGGIVKSIYNSISSVFVPNDINKNDCSVEVKSLIENLQTNLSVFLGVAETGILSIKDEIQFWLQKAQQSPTKSDKEAAKTFSVHLENLNGIIVEFQNLKGQQKLKSLDNLMDKMQYILDELWRIQSHQFPQNRMVSIIDVLSQLVVGCCIEDMNDQDNIWTSGSITINHLINNVLDIINNWMQVCDSMTRLFWTNCEHHMWIGNPYVPALMTKFKNRMQEILEIKQIYKQITILSQEDDTIDMTAKDYFHTFRDINIFDTSQIGEKYWTTAKMKFDKSLANVDEKVVLNIKYSIQNSLNNPRQVIYIFTKYENIMNRPKIKDTLRIECDHLHQAIILFVNELKATLLDSKSITQKNDDRQVSPVVTEIKWLKIIAHQIQQIDKVCQSVLNDRDDYEELIKLVNSFQKEVEQMLMQSYDKWCEQSLTSVANGDLVLKDNQPVVKFEKKERQLMQVTYNPKLLVFCQDIKYLKNFGYTNIPTELIKYGTIGKKYVKYAKNLQQIATFHNTIGDRIIPCQRPIMLKNAMELSNLVKSESVLWNDEESVKRYIMLLQDAINQLSKDNNLLSGYHETLKKTIIKLMSTDLLKQSVVWKDELRNMRDSIATLERKGYSNLQLFELHWDYQLYKALEHQLILFLIDSKDKLPDINIDIVFRQQQLQLRPTIEDIRFQYYSQLRRYLELTLNFHGFSNNSNKIFKVMVERNRFRFKTLYDQAERNFQRLCDFRDLWLPWVSLGCVNLENLCKVHLNTWEQWDKNFRSCKNFSQKIAKIQNSEERIDCFVVNVAPIRSHIEYISRSFWETLSMSLRSSILEDNSIVHEFITKSLSVLQHIPNDETSIITTSLKYQKIVEDLPWMTEMLTNIQNKNTCLVGWCKESVGSLDSLNVLWAKLLPLVENHHLLLQGHLEVITENLHIKINNVNDEAENFSIKWEDTLKDLEVNKDFDFAIYKERKKVWQELIDKKDELTLECEKVNPSLSAVLEEKFKEIESNIANHRKQWIIFEEFIDNNETIEQEEWAIYRRKPYVFNDFLSHWENQISNMITIPAIRIKKIVEEYRLVLPVLTMLQSDSLHEKHWANIFQIMNLTPKSYHEIKLSDVLKHRELLIENANEIKVVVYQAYAEQIVRQAITELEQWGVVATLKLFPHVDSKSESIMLIKDFQEALNKIGDNQCLLQSAKNTAAIDSYMDQIELWENKLNVVSFVLNNLCQIQKKWIYLEPIFFNGTFNGDNSFHRIDKDFRYIMKDIAGIPKVISLGKINNIQMIIESLLNQLQHCQNTLTNYMISKRELFPRFYFLSDDDLLEILGQSSKHAIIQKHISKLFPGINKLELVTVDKKSFIRSIHSAEGDVIQLVNEVTTSETVEIWLNTLDKEIKSTLKQLLKQCVQRNVIDMSVIEKFPMQILCLVNSFNFTTAIEKSVMSMTLSTSLSTLRNGIANFSSLLQSTDNNLKQLKIRALLLDLVYQVATVEYLMRHNITNLNDWHWLQQIKFYYNNRTDHISIKVVNADFEYSYEYLGNYNKLVYTSLTHNCYLTLTQAMYLGLGGCPFGPAGTGKTECVKSLGAMMGRLVLVFNCNENIDTSAMALILTGISRCGAWGCFDEFNRLQDDTLSAIAMLIQPLQIGLKEKQEFVYMLEKKITLNHHSCIFVTMNPADEDYGGRNQLPSNLQALFRPIVMQQPEPKEIAKVMLFIEGFKHAEEIGRRIVELFDLSNKLLSSQRHYDWGLRELKTVLNACGKSLKKIGLNTIDLQFNDEMEIVVKSLKPNVMSKLTIHDCQRFNMLLEDVFPHLNMSMEANDEFRNKIVETFQVMGLTKNDRQIDKCIELYEQLTKRIGVAVLGPPNSGKSTVISVLKSVLSSMSNTIRMYIISPKSMSRSQLLGHLNVNTRQWYDGVLTQTAIAVNIEPPEVTSWIICDGDVDCEWIEALNSVLDDNKLLTLPSGWRIQFGNNVNFIFETHDLVNASPATISRMGIINFSCEDLPKKLLIQPWIAKHSDADLMQLLMEKNFDVIFNCFEATTTILSYITKVSAVNNALSCLTSVESNEEFVVELIKVCNGMIQQKERKDFTNKILDMFNIYISNPMDAEYLYYNKFRKTTETYTADEPEVRSMSNNSVYQTLLFKTVSVKSNSDLLRSFLKNTDRTSFLIIGPRGNGKSLLINNTVAEFNGYQLLTVNCSAQLSANQILYILKQNCLVVSGIRGKEYKPKMSRLVLFLKNIDLCPVDTYGTVEVIELLLQIINRHGFFSDTLEWISISGLQICGTLSDVTKQNLSPRFMSKCNILLTNYANEKEMQCIVGNFLTFLYNKFQKNFTPIKKDKLAEIIIDIYREINEKFTSDVSHHYSFTPNMIEQWIIGMSYYPEQNFAHGFFYECFKIFGERLVNMEHSMIFNDIIRNKFQYFDISYDANDTFFIQSSAKSSHCQLFGSNQWRELIEKNLPICNSETAIIELPVTNELMTTVASMVRVLSRPCTNACLAGKLGSGRFESTVLACTILNIKIYYLQITKSYSLNDFYSDLKLTMQTCGLENEVAVLYIDQIWINYFMDILKTCEALLEDSIINDNLFGDDLETIASTLKSAAQLEGYQDSLVSFFLNRVKSNLHLVIALETTTTNFQEILKQYKSLYSKTEFIWFQDIAVTTKQVLCENVFKLIRNDATNQISSNASLSSKLFENVINYCGPWNESPKRSVQLIKTYYLTYLLSEKKKMDHKNKLELGIQKLSDSYKYVARLKEDSQEKEKALAEKRLLASQALEMISNTMTSANDQKSDMLKLRIKTEESGETLKVRKHEIQQELSLVEPLLNEASAAVGQIKTEALSEIRSLRAPPETIRDILEGVLRLMGIRDTSWNSMKSFLAKRGVKEDIKSLNPSQISPENCTEVERLIKQKSDSFDQKNAKRASAAAAPLASWVVACVKYSKVIQSIKPLEREQNELEKNLQRTENQMKSLSSGIDDVNVKVKELSDQLNVYTQEAAILEIKLEDTRNILRSTEVLVEKLSSEFNNWSSDLEGINNEIKDLDKQSMLISLCITHFSHMLENEKARYIAEICDLLHMPAQDVLYSDQDKLVWESLGLGSDKQSLENAALLTKFLDLPFGTAPIPLLLDPTGNAYKWLSGFLSVQLNKKFEILNQNDDRFTYNLELAVRFGKILIVEEVSQQFVPSLLSLIQMKVHCRFNKKMMHIGKKLIDLHDEFKLILITNQEVKSLNGDINANITIIPFTLTVSGLTDQLLSKWISVKHPETERNRIELLQNEGNLIQQKIILQDKLLHELSHAEGDILKNEKLLVTLNEIKGSSVEIERSLDESYQIRLKLMGNYNQYKEICNHSAAFFIGISKIYEVNTKSFTTIFLQSLDKQKDADDNVGDSFMDIVKKTYQMLSRSIKKSEQTTLGLNICKCSFSDKIPDIEWELFIFNFIETEQSVDERNIPKWIKKELVPKIASLKAQHGSFYSKLKLEDEHQWLQFIEAPAGSQNSFPNISVSDFQRLLVYQIFRPDQLLHVLNQTVLKLLNFKNESIGQSSIKQIFVEVDSHDPILILATTGAVLNEIEECAKNSVGSEKYREIYVDKEQETSNLNAVQRGAEDGAIICVRNVHLMPNFMINVDQKLKSLKIHANFKLIYVCETEKNLPKSILNKCRKLLIEPPNGIKHKIFNLLDQHQTLVKEKRDFKPIKLLMSLFILHSVLQERRNFIPQGWCKWYEFGDADIKAAIDFIVAINGKTFNVDWMLLKGLIKKVVYGGRIDNVQDFQKLNYLVEEYIDVKIMNAKWSPKPLNVAFPNHNNIDDYQNILLRAENKESKPEMFGLSPASSISRNITVCRNILKDLRKIYFNIDECDNYDKRIKPLIILWRKSMQSFNMSQLERIKEDSQQDFNPWQLFKSSEIILGVKLAKKITETLAKFSSFDINAMSDNEKHVLYVLSDNLVPLEWRKLWHGPKLASDFLKSVSIRIQSLTKFLDTLDKPMSDVDFSKIFNVNSFLSTVKLVSSRELKVSTSNLILDNFTNEHQFEKLQKQQKNVIKVSPLLIDGMSFENSKLVNCNGTTDNYTSNIYIFFKENSKDVLEDVANSFALPLYATALREKLLCTIKFETLLERSDVVYSGTCLIVPST